MADFILSGFADEADSNLDTQIKILKEAEISFVEMRGVDGQSLIDCDNEKVFEIKTKLIRNNIKLSSVGSYIGKMKITDDFAPHFDKFKRALEIATILESPNMRIFSFFLPQDEKPELFRDEVMLRMNRLLDEASSTNVSLCHENEKDIYGDIPSRVLDLHQTLGPRLKGIFDPANYIQCGVNNISESMKLLLPYTEYMHIKDARIIDGRVVPAGYGDAEFKDILQQFSVLKGERVLSIEPHLANFVGYENLGDDTSIKESREFNYSTNSEAFLFAAQSIKKILMDLEYHTNKKSKGGYQLWTK